MWELIFRSTCPDSNSVICKQCKTLKGHGKRWRKTNIVKFGKVKRGLVTVKYVRCAFTVIYNGGNSDFNPKLMCV